MRADKSLCSDRDVRSPIGASMIWLGGGHQRELDEPQERATHAVAGVLVLVNVALTTLAGAGAIAASTAWPLMTALPVALLCGVLVGAISRAVASGPVHTRRNLLERAAVALAVGVLVGELAALAVFAGSVDHRLDQTAAADAGAALAVEQATAKADRTRDARAALDHAVDEARARRDAAVVVARCEQHPAPGCPRNQITGVPGAGRQTRTANELLTDARRELDAAVATRERRAAELDHNIAAAEQELDQKRQHAVAAAERGLGARWVAMHDYTLGQPAAMLLRTGLIAGFASLTLLPLLSASWRGETSQHRRATARAEIDRAELGADTAIAVKRAEARAAAELLWAEQQLAAIRSTVKAQTEIDEAQQRRRITAALDAPAAGVAAEPPATVDNLPAPLDRTGAQPSPLIPVIPDIARSAARWVRPLVPPVVARAIDTTTRPARAMRQVFEEIEELSFTFKRTRRVNIDSPAAVDQRDDVTAAEPRRGPAKIAAEEPPAALNQDRPGELSAPDGPRELPAG